MKIIIILFLLIPIVTFSMEKQKERKVTTSQSLSLLNPSNTTNLDYLRLKASKLTTLPRKKIFSSEIEATVKSLLTSTTLSKIKNNERAIIACLPAKEHGTIAQCLVSKCDILQLFGAKYINLGDKESDIHINVLYKIPGGFIYGGRDGRIYRRLIDPKRLGRFHKREVILYVDGEITALCKNKETLFVGQFLRNKKACGLVIKDLTSRLKIYLGSHRYIHSISSSRDGTRLFCLVSSSKRNKKIHTYTLVFFEKNEQQQWQMKEEFPLDHQCTCVAFGTSNSNYALAFLSGQITVYSINKITNFIGSGEGGIISLEFNQDGSEIAAQFADGTQQSWNLKSKLCTEFIKGGGFKFRSLIKIDPDIVLVTFSNNPQGYAYIYFGEIRKIINYFYNGVSLPLALAITLLTKYIIKPPSKNWDEEYKRIVNELNEQLSQYNQELESGWETL